MFRFVFSFFVLTLLNCLAKEVHFEFSNDPNYPQLVSISNVNYHMVANKYIDFSATVTIYEEINDGTNVQISVSPDIPYARLINNMDVNLCTFCRREWPMYGRLIEATNGQFPDRCPIKPGVYTIQNMRIDLDKFPLLWRGFNGAASITLHKNGRVLTKFNLQGGITL